MSISRADNEALLAWCAGGCVGPKPTPTPDAPPVSSSRSVESPFEVAPARRATPSSVREARLRHIESEARRRPVQELYASEHAVLAADTGEDPEERRARLERMWAERGRVIADPAKPPPPVQRAPRDSYAVRAYRPAHLLVSTVDDLGEEIRLAELAVQPDAEMIAMLKAARVSQVALLEATLVNAGARVEYWAATGEEV